MAGEAGPDPLEVAAANGEPMPDNLTGAEQLLFLTLRLIYRDYRTGTTTKDQAKIEKAEAMRTYRDNLFRERMFADTIDRVKRSEAVRQEIEAGGCPLCKRLTRILDGREPYETQRQTRQSTSRP